MHTTRKIPQILLAAVVAMLLASVPASAESYQFSNGGQITIPSSGAPTSRYPSPVLVRNVRAPVTQLAVQINGLSHTRPRDLDILLVAPDGTGTVLMSDACGLTDLTDKTFVFKTFGNYPFMGPVTCGATEYFDTNLPQDGDNWPGAPAGPYNRLSQYHRKAINGYWRLFVVDDESGDSGQITGGWSLTLTTGPVAALVPGLGSVGPAEPYPMTRTLPTPDNLVITDLNVRLHGLAHDRANDLDILLVGPRGQKVMLMSDACGPNRVEDRVVVDDEAVDTHQDDSGFRGCYGHSKPVDYGPPEDLPAPAPPGPYATSLSAFDFTEAGGEWKLYARDDQADADGYLKEPYELEMSLREKATVGFSAATADLVEGGSREITLTRSATGPLGPGTVTVASTPNSATAGDFTPVATTVQFAAGESQKTIAIDALVDGAAEPVETYSVAITGATGDALVGPQAKVDATIAESAGPQQQPDGQPDGGPDGKPGPVAVPKCAGKPATIVGTAGSDVLRGTRKADVIVALGGRDRIKAARGNDIVCAGRGNDVVSGERGRDRLFGGAGNDRLVGGAARDRCLGGRGRDRAACERKVSAQ